MRQNNIKIEFEHKDENVNTQFKDWTRLLAKSSRIPNLYLDHNTNIEMFSKIFVSRINKKRRHLKKNQLTKWRRLFRHLNKEYQRRHNGKQIPKIHLFTKKKPYMKSIQFPETTLIHPRGTVNENGDIEIISYDFVQDYQHTQLKS